MAENVIIGTKDNMDPLVSVIVPCYNHENYVDACVSSIINQTYKNIQLIVLDDGSTDNSLARLQQLNNKHPFILIQQKNIGLIKTINKGLGEARGKYYAIFASDDVMTLDRIERQVKFLEINPKMVACGGNCLAIDEGGNPLPKQNMRPARTLNFEDIFFDKKPGIPAPTALVRTEPVKKTGGYREDIGIEDTWLWLKLTSQGHFIAALDTVEAYYRHHDDNMHAKLRYMAESMLKIYDEYKTHPGYSGVINRYLLSAFTRAAKYDKKLARQILRRYSGEWCNRKFIKSLIVLYLFPQNGEPSSKGFDYQW